MIDMSFEDFQKEGYEDVSEFERVWKEINGWWDTDAIVTVIEFKLVEENLRSGQNMGIKITHNQDIMTD